MQAIYLRSLIAVFAAAAFVLIEMIAAPAADDDPGAPMAVPGAARHARF